MALAVAVNVGLACLQIGCAVISVYAGNYGVAVFSGFGAGFSVGLAFCLWMYRKVAR